MKKNKIVIIAEAGVNHNGQVKNAFKLIDIAAKSGADYVKFQVTDSNLISKNAKKAKYQISKNKSETQFSMIKKLEMNWSKIHPLLIKRCNKQNIKFLTSIFDEIWVDQIESLNMDFIKIPSGEIDNFPMLEKVARLKKKILLSTGASKFEEIKKTVNFLLKKGVNKKNLIVMHCNSAYPTPIDHANVLAIKQLKEKLKLKVGFSDHTTGVEATLVALSLGICIVEKHFTISKQMKGPDHKISQSPKQLKSFVNSIRIAERALGSGVKEITKSEKPNRILIRKSIHANKDISKGEIFTKKNIKLKRPGNGIRPIFFNKVLGKKAKKNFKKDELIII